MADLPFLFSSEEHAPSRCNKRSVDSDDAFGGAKRRAPPLPFFGIPYIEPAPAPPKPEISPIPSDEEFRALCEAIMNLVQTVTVEKAKEIADYPQHIGLEANPLWLGARKHRMTGSTIGSIVGLNPYCSPDEALKEFIWPTFQANDCTRWGNENEDNVQDSFLHYCNSPLFSEMHCGATIENTGLLVSPGAGRGFAAMSPDGILSLKQPDGSVKRALCEWKAPYRQRNKTAPDDQDLYPTVTLPNGTRAPCPAYYFCQVQWGMGLMGLDRCFFGVWAPARISSVRVIAAKAESKIVATPKGLIQVTEIPFDKAFFEDMYRKVELFWRQRYVPAAALKEAGCLEEGEVSPTISV